MNELSAQWANYTPTHDVDEKKLMKEFNDYKHFLFRWSWQFCLKNVWLFCPQATVSNNQIAYAYAKVATSGIWGKFYTLSGPSAHFFKHNSVVFLYRHRLKCTFAKFIDVILVVFHQSNQSRYILNTHTYISIYIHLWVPVCVCILKRYINVLIIFQISQLQSQLRN